MRGKNFAKKGNVMRMTQNSIWCCGPNSVNLGSGKDTFIFISPVSILTRNGSTCQNPINTSNFKITHIRLDHKPKNLLHKNTKDKNMNTILKPLCIKQPLTGLYAFKIKESKGGFKTPLMKLMHLFIVINTWTLNYYYTFHSGWQSNRMGL